MEGLKVSLLTEIPEDLQQALQEFLDDHPEWSQDRVFNAALSLFLLQKNSARKVAGRVYVETLFDFAA